MIKTTKSEFIKLNDRISRATYYRTNIVEPLVQEFASLDTEVAKLEEFELNKLGIESTKNLNQISRLRNALETYNQNFGSENGFAVKARVRKEDLYLVKEPYGRKAW